ncbi:hypothetical protein CAQU_09220 [Corynebacterium aquilae DSM 44791]|uniref:Uncharacterized protein n=2 Tax=Corynebacterium aquilae TaxID=203263 RepID=A0A1L7CH84_9CORY|nr:hypothetical protein CAQU_09220 [Corynebacterium aquilae DSM 44791]
MRRWFVALLVATVLATIGVVLMVAGVVEDVQQWVRIGGVAAATALVVACLAEVTLRPAKGAC